MADPQPQITDVPSDHSIPKVLDHNAGATKRRNPEDGQYWLAGNVALLSDSERQRQQLLKEAEERRIYGGDRVRHVREKLEDRKKRESAYIPVHLFHQDNGQLGDEGGPVRLEDRERDMHRRRIVYSYVPHTMFNVIDHSQRNLRFRDSAFQMWTDASGNIFDPLVDEMEEDYQRIFRDSLRPNLKGLDWKRTVNMRQERLNQNPKLDAEEMKKLDDLLKFNEEAEQRRLSPEIDFQAVMGKLLKEQVKHRAQLMTDSDLSAPSRLGSSADSHLSDSDSLLVPSEVDSDAPKPTIRVETRLEQDGHQQVTEEFYGESSGRTSSSSESVAHQPQSFVSPPPLSPEPPINASMASQASNESDHVTSGTPATMDSSVTRVSPDASNSEILPVQLHVPSIEFESTSSSSESSSILNTPPSSLALEGASPDRLSHNVGPARQFEQEQELGRTASIDCHTSSVDNSREKLCPIHSRSTLPRTSADQKAPHKSPSKFKVVPIGKILPKIFDRTVRTKHNPPPTPPSSVFQRTFRTTCQDERYFITPLPLLKAERLKHELQNDIAFCTDNVFRRSFPTRRRRRGFR